MNTQGHITEQRSIKFEIIRDYVIYQFEGNPDNEIVHLIPKSDFLNLCDKKDAYVRLAQWRMEVRNTPEAEEIEDDDLDDNIERMPIYYISDKDLQEYKEDGFINEIHDLDFETTNLWEQAQAALYKGDLSNFVGWNLEIDGFLYNIKTKRPLPLDIHCYFTDNKYVDHSDKIKNIQYLHSINTEATDGFPWYDSGLTRYTIVIRLPTEVFDEVLQEAISKEDTLNYNMQKIVHKKFIGFGEI